MSIFFTSDSSEIKLWSYQRHQLSLLQTVDLPYHQYAIRFEPTGFFLFATHHVHPNILCMRLFGAQARNVLHPRTVSLDYLTVHSAPCVSGYYPTIISAQDDSKDVIQVFLNAPGGLKKLQLDLASCIPTNSSVEKRQIALENSFHLISGVLPNLSVDPSSEKSDKVESVAVEAKVEVEEPKPEKVEVMETIPEKVEVVEPAEFVEEPKQPEVVVEAEEHKPEKVEVVEPMPEKVEVVEPKPEVEAKVEVEEPKQPEEVEAVEHKPEVEAKMACKAARWAHRKIEELKPAPQPAEEVTEVTTPQKTKKNGEEVKSSKKAKSEKKKATEPKPAEEVKVKPKPVEEVKTKPPKEAPKAKSNTKTEVAIQPAMVQIPERDWEEMKTKLATQQLAMDQMAKSHKELTKTTTALKASIDNLVKSMQVTVQKQFEEKVIPSMNAAVSLMLQQLAAHLETAIVPADDSDYVEESGVQLSVSPPRAQTQPQPQPSLPVQLTQPENPLAQIREPETKPETKSETKAKAKSESKEKQSKPEKEVTNSVAPPTPNKSMLQELNKYIQDGRLTEALQMALQSNSPEGLALFIQRSRSAHVSVLPVTLHLPFAQQLASDFGKLKSLRLEWIVAILDAWIAASSETSEEDRLVLEHILSNLNKLNAESTLDSTSTAYLNKALNYITELTS